MIRPISAAILASLVICGVSAQSPKFRHVPNPVQSPQIQALEEIEEVPAPRINTDSILDHLTDAPLVPGRFPIVGVVGVPRVFSGYRNVLPDPVFSRQVMPMSTAQICKYIGETRQDALQADALLDSLANLAESMAVDLPDSDAQDSLSSIELERKQDIKDCLSPYIDWIVEEKLQLQSKLDYVYLDMVTNPKHIDYAYWNLPVPPEMPPEDPFLGVMGRKTLFVNTKIDLPVENDIQKKHWIHTLNTGLQFSQAYLSKNWYQGGNNYLALLGNFYWDVLLNEVYHPKMMFESTVSYKLGLNATEDNPYHKYSISEDLFQYNMKFGYKAAHHWYYSFTTQFKTQFLRNYATDSDTRIASFLTPSNLTLGLGMTYTKQNKGKTIQFNASLSPLSMNLKTAIDRWVDHTQFGIPQDARTNIEFGSTGELTFNWKMADMVTYKTRLFLFTDYKESNADWQNTFEFQFNRFFSTQLYFNLRYDSTADIALAPGWKRWMLKEILSVGLSYTFSTKN